MLRLSLFAFDLITLVSDAMSASKPARSRRRNGHEASDLSTHSTHSSGVGSRPAGHGVEHVFPSVPLTIELQRQEVGCWTNTGVSLRLLCPLPVQQRGGPHSPKQLNVWRSRLFTRRFTYDTREPNNAANGGRETLFLHWTGVALCPPSALLNRV